MARRNVSAAPVDDEDINITPLLDIVFIMLIFFIVTAVFIKEPGVDVTRPDAVTSEDIRRLSVLVAIRSDDTIWINKEEVELNEVEVRIRELRRETPQGAAVVQVDTEARSELMLDVVQAVKDAGIDNVNVATND